MNKCFELIIEGRVQGVGFRNFAYMRALKYNIKGYVKNTFEGNVEILCTGEDGNLDKFINEMRKGPSFCFISKFGINEAPSGSGIDNFEIRY
ncbi:MAG: acylphosphatase [Actinobacteria bacterium]|nr:acylphosphatase [Actinomycetota bacterium]